MERASVVIVGGGVRGMFSDELNVHYLARPRHCRGRFIYATGFSGHGFQQAPAVGEIVRDLYLGRKPFVDISPLAAGRTERHERQVV